MQANYFPTILVCWIVCLLIPISNAVVSAQTQQEELDVARSIWSFAWNDGFYDYQYRSGRSFPWLVEVRDGVVNQTTDSDGTIINSTTVPTIDDLFDIVQSSLDKGFSFTAKYNDTYGYPSHIRIPNLGILIRAFSYSRQPSYDVDAAQAKLDNAMALWESQSISAYIFEFEKRCFGCDFFSDYPWGVKVASGRPHRAIDANGRPVTDETISSVEDIFNTIQTVLDYKAFELNALYDESLGYPTSVYVDSDVYIADEEFLLLSSSMNVVAR